MAERDIWTIEEVARYLRVSERTVYDWAQKGEIPAGKIGTNWRFSRPEIERWVRQRLGVSKRPVSPSPLPLAAVLTPDRCIVLDTRSKEDALNALVDVVATASVVHDRDDLAVNIFKREELMSTGIGFGVGVPHVRLASVDDLVMGVGTCREGIVDYESLDDEPVRIVCMIAAGADQHAKHIKALAASSRKLKESGFRDELLAAADGQAIHDLMVREDQ